ncbi:MAG: hypothetical protein JWL71_2822 [Acidobacteria bacterium]|nr:hypothetical protein [Acidobacteriota bacterium]
MRLSAAIVCSAIVTLITTPLSASPETSARREDTRLTVALRINTSESTAIDNALIAASIEEANGVWRSYGVTLIRADPGVERCLDVDIQELPLTNGRREALMTPLGAIGFAADGRPDDRVRISMGAIFHLVSPVRNGPPLSQRPALLRDTILARVLGRVLAHEIGHFILRFPAHAKAGLMAANHTADEFSDRDGDRFSLTPLLEFRLRQILDEARRQGVSRLPDARFPADAR